MFSHAVGKKKERKSTTSISAVVVVLLLILLLWLLLRRHHLSVIWKIWTKMIFKKFCSKTWNLNKKATKCKQDYLSRFYVLVGISFKLFIYTFPLKKLNLYFDLDFLSRNWGQFHQRSTRSFYVRKLRTQLFCAYLLALYSTGVRLLA